MESKSRRHSAKHSTRSWSIAATLALAALLSHPGVLRADYDRSSGPPIAGDYSYLSYRSGNVSVAAASYDGRTSSARLNQPLVVGDRISTASGSRAEAILADGSFMWLDASTRVYLVAVANTIARNDRETALDLQGGRLSVRVPESAEWVRIDTQSATAYLEPGGFYRIDSTRNGLAVAVFQGNAEVLTRDDSQYASEGEMLIFENFGDRDDHSRARYVSLGNQRLSPFDRWALARSDTYRRPQRGERHLDGNLSYSSSMLDEYGDWSYIDDYGRQGWRPRVGSGAGSNWRPYSDGTWYSTPVGLTWLSGEPWGWVPYHYGTWAYTSRYGWVWFPDNAYSPAWVYWYSDPSYVGWAPVGYYDAYYHDAYGNRQQRSGGGGISLQIGFHSDWSGASLNFTSADTRPWNFVRVGDFQRVTPSVNVTQFVVPTQTVRTNAGRRGQEGILIAEPLVIEPRNVRSHTDILAGVALKGTPTQTRKLDVTPIFKRDAAVLPDELRRQMVEKPEQDVEEVVKQQRQRGAKMQAAQPPPAEVLERAERQDWRKQEAGKSKREERKSEASDRRSERGDKTSEVKPREEPAPQADPSPKPRTETKADPAPRAQRDPEERDRRQPVERSAEDGNAGGMRPREPRPQPIPTVTRQEPADEAPAGAEAKPESKPSPNEDWRQRDRNKTPAMKDQTAKDAVAADDKKDDDKKAADRKKANKKKADLNRNGIPDDEEDKEKEEENEKGKSERGN